MQQVKSYRKIVKQRDICCQLCASDTELQVHHIVWRAFGGTNEPENLILLCPTCHGKQHSKNGQSGIIIYENEDKNNSEE
jgi:5-methylcytosine-specific restriction endonuclease McrA